MIDLLRPTTAALIAAVLTAVVFLAAGFGIDSTRTVTEYQPVTRTCFPLDQWNSGNVSADYRPCAKVVQVEEDGSVRIQVSDADGTVRWDAGIGARDR